VANCAIRFVGSIVECFPNLLRDFGFSIGLLICTAKCVISFGVSNDIAIAVKNEKFGIHDKLCLFVDE